MPDGRSFEISDSTETVEGEDQEVQEVKEVKEEGIQGTQDTIHEMLNLAGERTDEAHKAERAPLLELRESLRPILKLAKDTLPGLLALQTKYQGAFDAVLSIDRARLRTFPQVSERTVELLIRAASEARGALASAIQTCASAPEKAKKIEQDSQDPRSLVSGRAMVAGFKAAVESTLDVDETTVGGAAKNITTYAEALNHQLKTANAPVKLINLIHPETFKRDVRTPRVEGFDGQVVQEEA